MCALFRIFNIQQSMQNMSIVWDFDNSEKSDVPIL